MKARTLAINYTHCYKQVAFIGFECVQIEPLVYNGLYMKMYRLVKNKF